MSLTNNPAVFLSQSLLGCFDDMAPVDGNDHSPSPETGGVPKGVGKSFESKGGNPMDGSNQKGKSKEKGKTIDKGGKSFEKGAGKSGKSCEKGGKSFGKGAGKSSEKGGKSFGKGEIGGKSSEKGGSGKSIEKGGKDLAKGKLIEKGSKGGLEKGKPREVKSSSLEVKGKGVGVEVKGSGKHMGANDTEKPKETVPTNSPKDPWWFEN